MDHAGRDLLPAAPAPGQARRRAAGTRGHPRRARPDPGRRRGGRLPARRRDHLDPAPAGRCRGVPAMLSRLLEAHETILTEAHDAAARVAELGDDGTNDLLVSQIIRTGELQAWFLAEHLVDTPLVRS
ncbi:ferritin-like domain-containing protein [Streptomyces sp. NPDC088760]|uniref:ferritin-like domain-containing protein n=1 Tax=Streptomyces sp. NPDC088760 TaxID=3365890 RepID=UPI003828D963